MYRILPCLIMQFGLATFGLAQNTAGNQEVLERSIGKIFLAYERDGADSAETLLMALHPAIKRLGCGSRVEFYYVLIMDLNLTGGPAEALMHIVESDECRDRLYLRLEKDILLAKKVGKPMDSAGHQYDGRRLKLAQYYMDLIKSKTSHNLTPEKKTAEDGSNTAPNLTK